MSSSIAAVLRRSGLRASVLRPLNLAPRLSAASLTPLKVEARTQSLCPASMTPAWAQIRCYSGADPLNMQFINDRVMLVLNLFDKIDNSKLSLESHFINDLGLDSLDHVEIMLMIEDEFGFEIPDDHGERLVTPGMIVKYVADHEDIYE